MVIFLQFDTLAQTTIDLLNEKIIAASLSLLIKFPNAYC